MARVTISQWSEKSAEKLETLVRKVSLDAFTEVILKSPVDTGRFRGNWMVGIGELPGGTTEATDKSGAAAINAAAAAAANVRLGQTINLVNNLPYSIRLEYGWSAQAPGGMVRITAARWQPIVDAAVAQIAGQG